MLLDSKALCLLFAGTALVASSTNGEQVEKFGGERRRLRKNMNSQNQQRELYNRVPPNIPDPTPEPTSSPTKGPTKSPIISWSWHTDGWNDDGFAVTTSKPTENPTPKPTWKDNWVSGWGSDGFQPQPENPIPSTPTSKTKGTGSSTRKSKKSKGAGPPSPSGPTKKSKKSNTAGGTAPSGPSTKKSKGTGPSGPPGPSTKKSKKSKKTSKGAPTPPIDPTPPIETPTWDDDGWKPPEITTPPPTNKPTKLPVNRWGSDGWKSDGHPTSKPTIVEIQTDEPTRSPTKNPTRSPTRNPTRTPTKNPTRSPTRSPTDSPTADPTASPVWSGDAWTGDGHKPTKAPSASPITTVVTFEPTSSPTNCEARLWHPNKGYSMCTNDFDYPPKWNTPEFKDQYLFESLKDCCKAVFGTGTCEYVDECNTFSPTKEPTASPVETIVTSEPTPSPTTCEDRLWHPNKGFEMCTNDFDYPIIWQAPELKDQYFFTSLQECCMAVFGSDTCEYVDECSTSSPTISPTPAPTICDERMKWHPDAEFSICTNSMVYPPEWATPEMEDQYFHNSLTECCTAVFGTPTCPSIDDCAPTASPTQAPSICEEREYHPNPGFTVCTNSPEYPPLWNHPELRPTYFYETIEACCEAVFGNPTCNFEDICNPTSSPSNAPTNLPTQEPTTSPTSGPTHSPTSEPTKSPTKSPSNEPTLNPTREPTVDPTKEPSGSPTMEPTVEPTPPEVITIQPTPSPSFGATPTVSKEVTGPPTFANMRGQVRSFVKEIEKDCHEVFGGNPQVCVYVCTEFTTMSDGREFAKTTEEHCPGEEISL